MRKNVKVLITTDSSYPADKKVRTVILRIIKKAVVDALTKNKVQSDSEVSVNVVGESKMLELSRKYLNDDSLHEVFAFGQEEIEATGVGFVKVPDDVLRLGDIVLCWSEVLKCAARDNVLVDREVYILTEHAVEHLLGKHHE